MLSTVSAEDAAAETADAAPHDDDATDNYDAAGEGDWLRSGRERVCRLPSFLPGRAFSA